jgi:hypothetical protein
VSKSEASNSGIRSISLFSEALAPIFAPRRAIKDAKKNPYPYPNATIADAPRKSSRTSRNTQNLSTYTCEKTRVHLHESDKSIELHFVRIMVTAFLGR